MTGLELTLGSPLRPQVTLRGACKAAPIEGCFVPRCVHFGIKGRKPDEATSDVSFAVLGVFRTD